MDIILKSCFDLSFFHFRSKSAKKLMSAVKGTNVVVVLAVKKSITMNLPNYHAFLTWDVRYGSHFSPKNCLSNQAIF